MELFQKFPVCLSEKMKRKVAKSKLSDEEIGTFLREAVSQIEQGSVLGIEELIERILK